MLLHLHIQNYAIIDQIDIAFSPGLAIITGETGAGKSILVGALSLILGSRADTTMSMDNTKKCFVEAIFADASPNVKAFFKAQDMDTTEEIVLRREISPNGKSRAFINDTPVNLQQLKELTGLLVDLHQQFDTLELGDNDFQRQVLDALAKNSVLLHQYQSIYKKYSSDLKLLETMNREQLQAIKDVHYNTFLLSELEEANIKENELEEIEASLKLQNNAESIKAVLTKIYFELQETERPLIQQIKSIGNQLQNLGNFDPSINLLTERMRATQIELQDIADEVDRLDKSVNLDNKKIEWLNERLSTGYRLLKKHGVNNTSQLLLIQKELLQKLAKFTSLQEEIDKLQISVNAMRESATQVAYTLSSNRKKIIDPFVDKISTLLTQVGMPNARLKVILDTGEINLYGGDRIEFLFDANKSDRFEPLRKVASGGELSRIMLAIKSLVAKSVQLPTMIFDEIDTGISGEAAKQVGIILKGLAKQHQVISITHQPQIAARATNHYFVYKEIMGDKIATSVKLLNFDERILTIATMLSGERPTAAAFENAREMIRN